MNPAKTLPSLSISLLITSLFALLGLSSCGDSFPDQKKAESLTKKFVQAYFKGDFDKVTGILPHDERVTGNLTLMEGFMEKDLAKVDKLGGLKKIEPVETRILENTAEGPTKLSVRYTLHFKKTKSTGNASAEARMIDRKWYVSSSNFFKTIPRS